MSDEIAGWIKEEREMYSKELHEEIKNSMVIGDYSLGEFHNGHKNIMKNGSNVIDVNLRMTGGNNLYARELVTTLNSVPDLLSEIDRLQSEHRWIPVETRLPEKDAEISALKDGDAYQSRFTDRFWYWSVYSYEWEELKGVTHWQPLPQAPEVKS